MFVENFEAFLYDNFRRGSIFRFNGQALIWLFTSTDCQKYYDWNENLSVLLYLAFGIYAKLT